MGKCARKPLWRRSPVAACKDMKYVEESATGDRRYMNPKEHREHKEMGLFAIFAISVVRSLYSNLWTPQ